jgi:hypothetical protein
LRLIRIRRCIDGFIGDGSDPTRTRKDGIDDLSSVKHNLGEGDIRA